LTKILLINTLVFGVGLVAFSHLQTLVPALLVLAVIGFGMMAQTTISNTLIQLIVVPSMRGRVLSYYAMVFFGMQPIGSLLIGTLSQHFGAPNTLLMQGMMTLTIVLVFTPFIGKHLLKPEAKMKIEQLKEDSVETTG
jgi:MFS family permease